MFEEIGCSFFVGFDGKIVLDLVRFLFELQLV